MNLHLHQIRLPLASFTLEIDATFDRPITGIFGPSGAGKTSLLDLVAGLRRPIAGAVELDNKILFDASRHLPSRLRRIGYVPQDLALFPHLNVRANLAYGCQRQASNNDLFTIDHVSEVMETTTRRFCACDSFRAAPAFIGRTDEQSRFKTEEATHSISAAHSRRISYPAHLRYTRCERIDRAL